MRKRQRKRLSLLLLPGMALAILLGMLVATPAQHSRGAPPGVPLTWGDNGRGQLGDGTLNNRPDPQPVPPLSNIIAIAGGGRHSLALSADGTVYAWGANDSGQLGDGTTTERDQPVKVLGLANIVAIAAGGQHSLALDASGQVWSWGDDSLGQLGDGSRMPFDPQPRPVPGLSGITQISAGDSFSLALDANGQVYGWGDDGDCELAFCGPPFTSTPAPLPVTGVRQISAGGHHVLALTISGDRVLAWGSDDAGQLGNSAGLDPNYPRRATPDFVLDGNGNPLDGIAQVSAGGQHSLAVRRSDGAVYAWGDNSYGQLGDGTLTGRETPDLAEGLRGVFKVAAGGHHSLALGGLEFRDDTAQPFVSSIAYGWGFNQSGQAGTHVFDSPDCQCRKLPATVTGSPFVRDPLLGMTDIAAGDIHSLALAASVATLQDELDQLPSIPDAGPDPSCDPGACPPPPCSGPTCPPPTTTVTATPCIPILTLINITPVVQSGRLDTASGNASGHASVQIKIPICPTPTATPCVPIPGAVVCERTSPTPTPTSTPCPPTLAAVGCPTATPCSPQPGQICQSTPTPTSTPCTFCRTPTPNPCSTPPILRFRIDSVDRGVGQRLPPPIATAGGSAPPPTVNIPPNTPGC